MSQLLAIGFIALGLIFGVLVFLVSREKPIQSKTSQSKTAVRSTVKPAQPVQKTPVTQTQETKDAVAPSRDANEATTISTATVSHAQPIASVAKDDVPAVVEQEKPVSSAQRNMPLPAWWHEHSSP